MIVGAGERRYEFVENWPNIPNEASFGQVVEIIVDSQDRVFIFHRAETSPMIFTKEGEYLGTWEPNDHWKDIHGVTIATDDDGEYLIVVDRDRHLVSRCDLDGNVAWSIGNKDQPGENGEPFYRPTDSAVAPNGDIYVADGYGNARVHQFTRSGEHVRSWGERGVGPGQFNLPHGVRVIERDGEPALYVCDRENSRIQVFTLDGQFLDKIGAVKRPTDIIADAEGYRYVPELAARVTILDGDDFVVAQIGGEEKKEPGYFVAPHTLWLDSEGSMYVGEVLEGQRVSKYRRVRG